MDRQEHWDMAAVALICAALVALAIHGVLAWTAA